jgi:hypothetical protein
MLVRTAFAVRSVGSAAGPPVACGQVMARRMHKRRLPTQGCEGLRQTSGPHQGDSRRPRRSVWSITRGAPSMPYASRFSAPKLRAVLVPRRLLWGAIQSTLVDRGIRQAAAKRPACPERKHSPSGLLSDTLRFPHDDRLCPHSGYPKCILCGDG